MIGVCALFLTFSPLRQPLINGRAHALLHHMDVVVVDHQVPNISSSNKIDFYIIKTTFITKLNKLGGGSIPAEILYLPPGLCDDFGLVGVDGDAHAALQRPVCA